MTIMVVFDRDYDAEGREGDNGGYDSGGVDCLAFVFRLGDRFCLQALTF
jgi:hypothetical protein